MKRAGRSIEAATLALLALTAPGSAYAQEPARNVPADAVTLEQIYARAWQRNPRLEAARALAVAVGAQESAAGLVPDPSLQLGVMNLSLPNLRADMPSSMAPSILLMQMVPFPGKLGLSERIAEQSSAMAEANAAETWWEVRSQAAMAFYELYEADRQIEVMQETLALLQDFEQVAKAMYSAGEGRQSDVLRANVEVARMDAEIRRMQAMRRGAAARLNGILNLPVDSPIATPVLAALPADLPSADTLREWAESSRPMLERGRLGLEQAGTRRALARKELWPDLMLGVQYAQRAGEMGTERMGSAMVGFSLPVFASRRQLRMREEAAAMEQMARADLTQMRAGVNARIGELLAHLERDRTLLRLYRADVLPQARANVESAFTSYRVGTIDFMTLVDARMTVNGFEQELYALLAGYGRALAELEMTVGRRLPNAGASVTEES
jgi:outer membrane protein TolC